MWTMAEKKKPTPDQGLWAIIRNRTNAIAKATKTRFLALRQMLGNAGRRDG